MRTLRLLVVALLVSGCASLREERGLVDNTVYTARGPEGWSVEIGDDIALRLGHNFFSGDTVSAVYRYPGRTARSWRGVRRWRSGIGLSRIMVEARPGACVSGRLAFREQVRVRHNGLTLTGCGGAPIGEVGP